MKYFIPFLFLLGSCSASNTAALKCNLQDGLEGVIAYAIETAGQCSGSAAIRASVNGWVASADPCTVTRGGACSLIAGAITATVSGAAQGALSSKFPDWHCNPQMLLTALQGVATTACMAILPNG